MSKLIKTYYDKEKKQLSTDTYMLDGKIHNVGKPAQTTYYRNSVKADESYYDNGQLHNTEGPAFRTFDRDGNLQSELWYLRGKLIDHVTFMKDNNFTEMNKEAVTLLLLIYA